MTSPFGDGNRKNQINCVPAIRDRNKNFQKAFPLFVTGTGNPKTLHAFREREFKTFPLGNIRVREFPLMPAISVPFQVIINVMSAKKGTALLM